MTASIRPTGGGAWFPEEKPTDIWQVNEAHSHRYIGLRTVTPHIRPQDLLPDGHKSGSPTATRVVPRRPQELCPSGHTSDPPVAAFYRQDWWIQTFLACRYLWSTFRLLLPLQVSPLQFSLTFSSACWFHSNGTQISVSKHSVLWRQSLLRRWGHSK